MEQTESHPSRRNVLFVLGGAALAAGAVIAAPVRDLIAGASQSLINGAAPPRATVNLASASYEQWLAQVNANFAVAGGNPLKLLGVEPLNSVGQRPAGLRARAFALTFNVTGSGTMASDLIYTISHAQHGALRIFLTAADPRTPNRMLAVFN